MKENRLKGKSRKEIIEIIANGKTPTEYLEDLEELAKLNNYYFEEKE